VRLKTFFFNQLFEDKIKWLNNMIEKLKIINYMQYKQIKFILSFKFEECKKLK